MTPSWQVFFKRFLFGYAAAVVVLGVYLPVSDSLDPDFEVAVLAGGFAFPSVLYIFGALRIVPHWGDHQKSEASAALAVQRFLGFTGSMYSLLVLVLYGSGFLLTSASAADRTRVAWTSLVALIGIWFNLGAVYHHLVVWPARSPNGSGSLKDDKPKVSLALRAWDRALGMAHRLLWPFLIALLAGVLLASSLTLPITDGGGGWSILRGESFWATAEYGLGHGFFKTTIAGLGRILYACGLLAAAMLLVVTAVQAAIGAESAGIQVLRRWLHRLAAILGTYSVIDLYFGWLGFTTKTKAIPLLSLTILMSIQLIALIPLGVTIIPWRGRLPKVVSSLRRGFLLFHLPASMFCWLFFPLLFSVEFPGLGCFFIGMQLLLWAALQFARSLESSSQPPVHAWNNIRAGTNAVG
jgi:hypothetical protein